MRIFVTGSTGYIGNAVARAFQRHGHHVIGLVRNPEKAKLLKIQEIQPVIGELNQLFKIIPSLENIDVIVHCAFEWSQKGVQQELETIEILTKGIKKPRLPQTLLYTSGVYVYGNTGKQPATENTSLNPPNLVKWRPDYEEKVLNASSQLLHTVVIRPACVFGGSGGLTGMWFDSVNGMVPMVGEGENHMALVHIDDLSRAYVLAAEKGLDREIFNIADHSRYKVKDLASQVAKVSGLEGHIQILSEDEAIHKYGPITEGLLLDQQVCSQRAQRMLGWQPRQPNFMDGIQRYYQAWKAAK